ncbi:hypothetical protein, unlikely [Trypanosoma brucei gambiense DAL972]|uniref:Uncharacterized protein n=1 Tax=Trypanosoma brucei gambiense (strain MHOM/CI/86/DAL972) TaxID=679716 RepID=C9ZSC2_TRYB9|nr:hypothetical protein, unlikely [Trypanosoma brucei gambiense DAL972]CBH12260.1 hypothetical protein, unlikely [Trypanosoma brucei gambiense DAL972]|eukprot:XP_011774541.1 hypothetical protein, unlikely [Trypanosoma brucei gambiense DAL972]
MNVSIYKCFCYCWEPLEGSIREKKERETLTGTSIHPSIKVEYCNGERCLHNHRKSQQRNIISPHSFLSANCEEMWLLKTVPLTVVKLFHALPYLYIIIIFLLF